MNRGRPKGHSPYIEISYEELGDWVGKKSKVLVSKKWLDSIVDQDYNSPIEEPCYSKVVNEEPKKPTIEYNITKF